MYKVAGKWTKTQETDHLIIEEWEGTTCKDMPEAIDWIKRNIISPCDWIKISKIEE